MSEKDADVRPYGGQNQPIQAESEAGAGAPGYGRASRRNSVSSPFQPDRIDAVLALAAYILGFFFVRWVMSGWQGWGVGLFTLMYCGAVTVYLLKRGVRIPGEGWFWLGVVVLNGLSYSLWANNGLEPWRSLLLFGSAVYWIIIATGSPILGRTSSLFWLDGINALWVIPFRNFGCQYKSLAYLSQRKKAGWSQAASIALGVILALIVASVVLPLLMEADSGGFALLADGLTNWLESIGDDVWQLIFEIILAIPVAAYMFGLIAGSAHRRGTDSFSRDGVLRGITDLQIVPAATIYTLLGLLGASTRCSSPASCPTSSPPSEELPEPGRYTPNTPAGVSSIVQYRRHQPDGADRRQCIQPPAILGEHIPEVP